MDYKTAYDLAIENPDKYWSIFSSKLEWFKKWDKALDNKWFINGETNIALNSLNHSGKALIWYGEEGKTQELTYSELDNLSSLIAGKLKSLGVNRGDKVAIYMPNSIEAIASVLACAKIGAIYTLIFAGLGEEAIKNRLNDFKPKILIKASYTNRRGKRIPLYFDGDIVFDRESTFDFDTKEKNYERIESNEPLKVMYTSGTTGKPKGIILPHGAWMVGDYTVFDIMFSLKPKDVVFTTADIGWITFSRIMYATLLHGGTLVFMEGAPDYPKDRIPKIIEETKPKLFFTSPTLLRLLRKLEVKIPKVEYSATAGEIMDEETWNYTNYADKFTDVYGQTELGYVVGVPFALGVEAKKGYAGVPFPGVVLDTLDDEGKHTDNVGYLMVKSKFPTQFIGVLNNEIKYKEYFKFGYHDTGDLAIIRDNYIKIVGRADDMIKIAGHRITSGEVESVISEIPGVIEVAAIGIPDEIKGEKLIIFIVGNANENEVKERVRKELGSIYVIDKVYNVPRLPKSRSGKIVRRALRDVLLGRSFDSTLLEDPEVLKEIEYIITNNNKNE
ncbi:AMP-binding protein [Acidianus sulfidivorans JP7]|uniref:AMP-binding protein n=1 Tax=Acidianus sulfidivorans TaxID=312539 RepID=UPI001443627B|nr:AMP-binding protein [Acidianus sulfidivorans]AWR97912.2 AMP-binding protein [Acidianus sulfidivorans JP7]